MKIILLKDVPKIGRKYETKEVSEGYAVNMLIPRGMAVAATSSEIKRINIERAKIEGERKIHEELLVKTLQDLDGKTIKLQEKLNEKGHLFAGLHKAEVLKVIKDQTRLELNDEHLVLEKPIKEAGEHILEVQGAGKKIKLQLIIEAKK